MFENKRKEAEFEKFLKFLGLDGYFILLLVERNVSTIAALAIVDSLFEEFRVESQRNGTPESISHGPPSYNGNESVVKRQTSFWL
jgi:hypothetical protein